MSEEKVVVQSGGIGISWILFIVFMVLKLTGVINWSWWWITAPLWISFGFILFLLIVIFIIAMLTYDK